MSGGQPMSGAGPLRTPPLASGPHGPAALRPLLRTVLDGGPHPREDRGVHRRLQGHLPVCE
ncbi:hypothetical protein ACWD4N_30000, partial [Streptomyces sp. NPDC002586]